MERTNGHDSQYASSLIEASLDPLFTVSLEGKITDMNQATVNVTGSTRQKLTGSNFFDYFTDPQKARKVYLEVFERGFVKDYPLTIKDHKSTDVLFNGSVYKGEKGKVVGAVVVARDITEQKRIANELNEAKICAELAAKNAQDAKIKAEHATQLAVDAVKLKQQFLSNMSHEIRTPMNAIIGFTKVLLNTNLSEKQKEYLSAIKTSGDALIVIIDDILDLAKVDAGKMTFEQTPFKMALSVSAMLHLFETKIQEKNLELVIEYDNTIPEFLIGDPARLHQIILNLVSNAIKFTRQGQITVSVKLLKEDEEKVIIEFSVSDTGIGIPEDKLKNIFENFQQASCVTSRLYGGTGHGLAIVKQLVEPQGGIIHVESKVNKGSTFSFTLTFKKTLEVAAAENESIEKVDYLIGKKVLVVEDIALNQLLMKTILDDFGFERDVASNGKIAIEMLKHKTFDIILMDLQMPEMNGFETTEYIRKTLKSKIPIIALTADVASVDLERCKSAGMDDSLAKPLNEKLLYNKIRSLLKSEVAVQGKKSDAKVKYINMDYLYKRTKSNPKLITETITLHLEQTPQLVSLMKRSFLNKDWDMLHSSVHKMIPSFSIMGIDSDYEKIARKIQDYANNQQLTDDMHDMVAQLENVCVVACKELEEELHKIKTGGNG